jgi:hypothetical protein
MTEFEKWLESGEYKRETKNAQNKIQYHETTDKSISIDINKVLEDVEHFNEIANTWTMQKPIDINYGKLLGNVNYKYKKG